MPCCLLSSRRLGEVCAKRSSARFCSRASNAILEDQLWALSSRALRSAQVTCCRDGTLPSRPVRWDSSGGTCICDAAASSRRWQAMRATTVSRSYASWWWGRAAYSVTADAAHQFLRRSRSRMVDVAAPSGSPLHPVAPRGHAANLRLGRGAVLLVFALDLVRP